VLSPLGGRHIRSTCSDLCWVMGENNPPPPPPRSVILRRPPPAPLIPSPQPRGGSDQVATAACFKYCNMIASSIERSEWLNERSSAHHPLLLPWGCIKIQWEAGWPLSLSWLRIGLSGRSASRVAPHTTRPTRQRTTGTTHNPPPSQPPWLRVEWVPKSHLSLVRGEDVEANKRQPLTRAMPFCAALLPGAFSAGRALQLNSRKWNNFG